MIIRKVNEKVRTNLLLIIATVAVPFFLQATDENTEQYSGKDLYRINCAGCHGLDRCGIPPTYPSLIGMKERLSKEQVRQQLKNGKGLMPPFPFLSDVEIKALQAYLYDEPVKLYSALTLSPVDLGKRLFQSNCSACHQATTHDPIPIGIPFEHPMIPAPLAGATKRFTKEQFFTILQSGPGFMPSYNHFQIDEREALWIFVKTLEGKGEPSGMTMLEMHPQMIGMSTPMRMMNRMGMGTKKRPGHNGGNYFGY